MNAKRTCETCVFWQDLDDNLTGVCRKNAPSPLLYEVGKGAPPETDTDWTIVYITAVCGEHRTEAEFEAERAHASGILATLVDRNTRLLGEHNKLAAEVRAHGQEIAERIAKLTEHRRRLAVTLAYCVRNTVSDEQRAEVLGCPGADIPLQLAKTMARAPRLSSAVALLLSYLENGKLPEEAKG